MIATAAMVGLLKLPVNTIGDLYTISGGLPPVCPACPVLMRRWRGPAGRIHHSVILAAIESLLSCVVADEMIGGRHNSTWSWWPRASAIPPRPCSAGSPPPAPSPGQRPTTKMEEIAAGKGKHAVVVLVTLVFLAPLAALILMPCIAAIPS